MDVEIPRGVVNQGSPHPVPEQSLFSDSVSLAAESNPVSYLETETPTAQCATNVITAKGRVIGFSWRGREWRLRARDDSWLREASCLPGHVTTGKHFKEGHHLETWLAVRQSGSVEPPVVRCG